MFLYLKHNNYLKKFRVTTPANPSYGNFAHTYSKDQNHIKHLYQFFWGAPDVGIDSKAGTIIHEVSHSNEIGVIGDFDDAWGDFFGTADYSNGSYGVAGAQALKTSSPDKAMRHADSFEYHIEGAW